MKKMFNRKGLLASAGLAMALSSPAMAADVSIGALMPMTGGLQAYGEACLNGVKLAAKEVNSAGGILGGNVVVKVGDTQTKSQPALDAAKKLAELENVAGIVGALASGNSIPVAQTVAATSGTPMISPASTAPALTTVNDNDFLFRTTPSDAYQGVALAQLALEKGVTKVATLYVNNDYGDGLANAFKAAFEANGGEVVEQSAFEPNKASYRGELSKLADGGAEHLLLIAYPDDGGISITKQSLEEGYFGKFIMTDGMKAEKVIETIGQQYLEGVFGTAAKSVSTEAGEAFNAAYQAEFGELPPRPYIDTSFDAAMLLALAIEKAGSADDGAKIRDALREVATAPGVKVGPGDFAKAKQLIAEGKDIDYVGASGGHEFDAAGDVSGTFEHWEINDGKLNTVKVFEPK